MSIEKGLPADLGEQQMLLIKTAAVTGRLLAENTVDCEVSLTVKDGLLEPWQTIGLSSIDVVAGSLYEYGVHLRDPNSEELRILKDRAPFESYTETTLDDGETYSNFREALELTRTGEYHIVTDRKTDNQKEPQTTRPATLQVASSMLDDFCSRVTPLTNAPQLVPRNFPGSTGLLVPATGLVPVMGRVLEMVADALQPEQKTQFDGRIKFSTSRGEFDSGDQIIDFSTRNADGSRKSHFILEVGRYNSPGFRTPKGRYVQLWCSYNEVQNGTLTGGYLGPAKGNAFLVKQMEPEPNETVEQGGALAGHITAVARRIIKPLTNYTTS